MSLLRAAPVPYAACVSACFTRSNPYVFLRKQQFRRDRLGNVNKANIHTFMQASPASNPVQTHPLLDSSVLWERAVQTSTSAKQKGAIYSIDTSAELFHDEAYDITYVLRIATALKDKPKPKGNDSKPGVWRNPFLPYEEDLWVGHLSTTHTLLLNKFNVVANHMLVVTREFQSQQEPLNETDFAATMTVLQGMPSGGLAFYNCGPHSGRSQPHKHLQVVPLPFEPSTDPEAPVHQNVMASGHLLPLMEPFEVRSLPFQAFALLLPPGVGASQLEVGACRLLALCQQVSRAHDVEGAPSYNVLLTQQFMMMVPRSNEYADGLAINSLGFAGTILVRSPEELALVKETGPTQILKKVGFEWDL